MPSPIPFRTDKRSMQSRINGKLSHGPVTAEGKFKSSRNSLRHGLLASKHVVLKNEIPARYSEVRAKLIEALHPATEHDLEIIEKIAGVEWRLDRLVMIEAALTGPGASVEEITERFSSIDGIEFIADAWTKTRSVHHCLALLHRYSGTLEKQLNSFYGRLRTSAKAA